MSLDIVIIMVFITGTMVGLVAWDLMTRKLIGDELKRQLAESEAAAKMMVEAHNNMTQQLRNMGDKVSAHDMMLRGGGGILDQNKGLAGRKL